MKLLFATRDLVRDGRTFEGLPLLLNDDMTPAEPAQTFLWHVLVESGSVTSQLTWEHYGRWLYDFFQFLQENGLAWDALEGPAVSNPLMRYRQWALEEVGSSRRTVNLYTGLVRRFYAWAHRKGYIAKSPVAYREIRPTGDRGLLSHVRREITLAAGTTLREHKKLPALLTMDQVRYCRMHFPNESHRLLFELMVQAGLRSSEARTFPLSYVFNPRLRKDELHERALLPVTLDPRDMEIKYSKSRMVHIPLLLMERLNAYAVQRRSGLAKRQPGKTEFRALILGANGGPYSKDVIVEVFTALEERVGFRVRPHMLRHTYATYVLRALRKSKDFHGEPLLYVRDRLGHSNVETTSIYLHLITQLEAEMVLAHEEYIDELFSSAKA
jgi:site-specific recombinase XerD